MAIEIKSRIPDYEKREEIECVTLTISCVSTDGRVTVLSAHLDKGLSTEREVTWFHAEDHPVFVFRKKAIPEKKITPVIPGHDPESVTSCTTERSWQPAHEEKARAFGFRL